MSIEASALESADLQGSSAFRPRRDADDPVLREKSSLKLARFSGPDLMAHTLPYDRAAGALTLRLFATFIYSAVLLLFYPSILAANTLYFPKVHDNNTIRTGVAISNGQNSSGTLNLALFDTQGQLRAEIDRLLAPSGQIVDMISSLFDLQAEFTGWLRVSSDLDLHGLGIQFLNNGQISDSPALTSPEPFQYLAHVAAGSGWVTAITVVNPSNRSISGQMILYDQHGLPYTARSFELPAFFQIELDVAEAFRLREVLSGHLEVSADGPLLAVETFSAADAVASVSGSGSVNRLPTGKIERVFPFVSTGPRSWTGIAYVNQASTPTAVRLNVFSSNGSLVGQHYRLLDAKAQDLFLLSNITGNWQGDGYAWLEADGPVSGFQLLGGEVAGRFAGWGSLDSAARRLYIPHIAENLEWSSLISLINVSPLPAEVHLRAFDSNGNVTAEGKFELDSLEQMLKPVNTLLAVDGQIAGSIEVTSTQPLIGANLYTMPSGVAAVRASPSLGADIIDIESSVLAGTMVSAGTGGQLNIPGDPTDGHLAGLTVTIPAAALPSDTFVRLHVTAATLPFLSADFRILQYPVRLEPFGSHLLQPVRVAIPIPTEVIEPGLFEAISVFSYNEQARTWLALPVRHDRANRSIEVEVTRLGTLVPVVSRLATAAPLEDRSPLSAATELEYLPGNSIEQAGSLIEECRSTELLRLGAGGLNATLASPQLEATLEIIDLVCTYQELRSALNQDNLVLAGAIVSGWAGKTTGKVACNIALVPGTPAERTCSFAFDALQELGTRYGEWLGSQFYDIKEILNNQRIDKQLTRYFKWRKQGKGPNEVPVCSNNWFPDPDKGPDCDYDDEHCVPFVADFPCSPIAGLIDRMTPEQVRFHGDLYFEEFLRSEQRASILREVLRLAEEEFIRQQQKEAFQLMLDSLPSVQVTPSNSGEAPFRATFQAVPPPRRDLSHVKRYIWDFGDGSRIEANSRVEHLYEREGAYLVIVTFVDSSGNSATVEKRVSVTRRVSTAISVDPTLGVNRNELIAPGYIEITGSGFTALGEASVRWRRQNGGVDESKIVQVSGGGTFTASISFSENAPVGVFYVTAEDRSTGIGSPSIEFLVRTTLSPPSIESVSPSRIRIEGRDRAETFMLSVRVMNLQDNSHVRVQYGVDGIYNGGFYRKGELTGIIPANVIGKDKDLLNVPVRLSAGKYDLIVVSPNLQESKSARIEVTLTGDGSGAPTITSYSWRLTPVAGQPFDGTITGTGFETGIEIWFCRTGTNNCSQHPAAGVTVNSSTMLSVSSVNLSSGGSYQFYLQTSTGQSRRSTAFIVQDDGPQKPIAAFTMSGDGTTSSAPDSLEVTVGSAGVVTIRFSAAASRDADGKITAYDWRSGSERISGESDFEKPFAPGIYGITLTVTDDDGMTASASATLRVRPRQVGTVEVRAIRNSEPWWGSLDFDLIGPAPTKRYTTVPTTLENMPIGTYTIKYQGGGPENATFSGYAPASSQELPAGGSIAFVLDFELIPLGPFTLTAVQNCSDRTSEILLSWTESAGASAYTVFIDDEDNPRAMGSQMSFTHSNLSDGSTHTYFVRANDNYNQTKDSNSVTVDAPYCDALNFDLFQPDTPWHTGRTLTYTSTIYGGNPPFTYEWGGEASGSGTWSVSTFNSPGPEFSKIYSNPGTYTVSLTLTDANGQQEVRSVTHDVVDPPPDSGTIHVSATYNDSNWEGEVTFRITGRDTGTIINGSMVPVSYTEVTPDQYTIEYLGGGPSGARLNGVTPGSTATLWPGDQIYFSFTFVP